MAAAGRFCNDRHYPDKAAQLSAALEIARRAQLPDSREEVTLKKASAVSDYLRTRLQGLPEEHFRALYLNRRSVLIEDALLATGTAPGRLSRTAP